ncbi:PREDICTED: T-cell ecto-ADP-ribosyltransferase 1-like [Cyprinodon variegatus]|uniref:NAD(P)(+)--arginine ADP-ribosyltransferase n=1 Tax=Cyprinodon variegatus TaxID=28743 RepID=A0A3Q2DNW9_CYPVA|nr:PREDICTED: T-cell ecto-ADP-ribosyltransferase 1-like [Cyprinodon variegatus]
MYTEGKKHLVLLIVLIFYCQVTLSTSKLLNASSAVIDDLYDGCREEAMKKFNPDVLKQELGKSEKLQKAWNKWEQEKTRTNCSSKIPGGSKEHTSALSVFYYYRGTNFIKELNNAVEMMMTNVTTYENDFHFKALHFLLMDSMKLLKPKECKEVYLVQEEQIKQEPSSSVRFASFIVAETDLELIDYVDQVVLKIKTCFYVDLGDQLCQRYLGKILLSPAEVFTVETVAKKENSDGDEFIEVVLAHSALRSNHNCIMFSRSAADINAHLFLPLLAALAILSTCL